MGEEITGLTTIRDGLKFIKKFSHLEIDYVIVFNRMTDTLSLSRWIFNLDSKDGIVDSISITKEFFLDVQWKFISMSISDFIQHPSK